MKMNKLFLATMAAVIATPAIVQTIPMEVKAATTQFKDITSSNPHKVHIETLVSEGVIQGFSDGTFRPSENVNRGQFALFISRALDLPMPSNQTTFKDVSKDAVVYEGIVKAQAAGIIQGYTDGRFKAGDLISRGDMAIMLDRALQYKSSSSYTKKATLTYSDKGKIGATALSAVQRLTYYNVMGALSGSSFSATSKGTRLDTVISIYQLMATKKLFSEGVVVTPPPTPTTPPTSGGSEIDKIKAKNPLDLTLNEVVKAYGPYVIQVRYDIFGENQGIINWNIWDQYMDYIADAKEYNYKTVQKPDAWLAERKQMMIESQFGEVSGSYPNYELIGLNGKPYYSSEIFNQTQYNLFTNGYGQLLPIMPTSSGQFLIDVMVNKKDFATYQSNKVDTEKLVVQSYKKNGDIYVDVQAVFKDTPQVQATSTSLTYNGTTVQFNSLTNKAETKNGRVMVPIKEVAEKVGLHTRAVYFVRPNRTVDKIEITNYAPVTDSIYDK